MVLHLQHSDQTDHDIERAMTLNQSRAACNPTRSATLSQDAYAKHLFQVGEVQPKHILGHDVTPRSFVELFTTFINAFINAFCNTVINAFVILFIINPIHESPVLTHR